MAPLGGMPLARPLGELSPQATERALAVTVSPLRLRFAQTPLPKGEAKDVCTEFNDTKQAQQVILLCLLSATGIVICVAYWLTALVKTASIMVISREKPAGCRPVLSMQASFLRRAALKHREGDHTDENGKQRTRRVGQSHRQKRLREQAGHQICAGDAHQKA